MKATVLIDNKAGDIVVTDFRELAPAKDCESAGACGLEAEWGLAIYIEYEDKKILLDTGASGTFARNAEKLGINLADVDFGVLSHAHYDHADGMETFFEINLTAPFFLSSDAKENCYSFVDNEMKYDGIKMGTLKKYAHRIEQHRDLKYEICEGVYLLGHATSGLDAVGERVGQYVVENYDIVPDDFAHEQSLIFETAEGLVIFNSCSHSGVDVIIREAQKAFPGQSVYAIVGGFHMFMDSEEEVREHARRILAAGAKRIVTGHCTGSEQYEWLKNELAGNIEVEQLCCGLEIVL